MLGEVEDSGAIEVTDIVGDKKQANLPLDNGHKPSAVPSSSVATTSGPTATTSDAAANNNEATATGRSSVVAAAIRSDSEHDGFDITSDQLVISVMTVQLRKILLTELLQLLTKTRPLSALDNT